MDEVVRLRSTQQPSALTAKRLFKCNRPGTDRTCHVALIQRKVLKGPHFFGLRTRKNTQRWPCVGLFPGPSNLLLHRWGLGLRKMVTFFAKEKQNARSYALAWRPECAGTSSLQTYHSNSYFSLRKRNRHEEGYSGSDDGPLKQDLFDSDQQRTPCTACGERF